MIGERVCNVVTESSTADTPAALQVRKMAVEIVQGLTGSPQGVQQLSSQADKLAPALLARLGDEQVRGSRGFRVKN